jgi:hypothetical protein
LARFPPTCDVPLAPNARICGCRMGVQHIDPISVLGRVLLIEIVARMSLQDTFCLWDPSSAICQKGSGSRIKRRGLESSRLKRHFLRHQSIHPITHFFCCLSQDASSLSAHSLVQKCRFNRRFPSEFWRKNQTCKERVLARQKFCCEATQWSSQNVKYGLQVYGS